MAQAIHKVGYCKPPMETRFRPGRSGNPKGRPRGSKNSDQILLKLLDARVFLGGHRKISRREAMLRKLVDQAVGGDMNAISTLWKLMRELDTKPEPESTPKGGVPFFDVEELKRKYGSIT